MSDFYGYDEPRYPSGPRRGKGWGILFMILVCLGAGAGLMYLGSIVFSSGNNLVAGVPTPTAMVTAGDSLPTPTLPVDDATPSPGVVATPFLPPAGDIQFATSPLLNPSLEGSIPDIYDAVSPSVVLVANKAARPNLPSQGGDGMVEQATGSGVIISQDGYIVTNNHVIEGADEIMVTIRGQEFPAKVIGADRNTDLAIIKIDQTGLPAVPIADSDSLRVGENVVAIGNPLGKDLLNTITQGIISGLDRELLNNGYPEKMIQTNAAINFGNSGGALLNMKGELIGIITMKSVYAGMENGMPISAEGIGFAIPSAEVKPIIEDLILHGLVRRPTIGIEGGEVVANQVKQDSPAGVFVSKVRDGGAAQRGGMQPEDIIIAADGKTVETFLDLYTTIQSHAIGDQVQFTVWRDGENVELTVVTEVNQPAAE